MSTVLFHTHGIGRFDYSSLQPDDLEAVDALAREHDLTVLPTVYLRRDHLASFTEVMKAFDALKRDGRLPAIAGFAMEGPLLGPEGGIPRAGSWTPTGAEWRAIASLGTLGLRYVVMAPDALALDEKISTACTFAGLLTELYDQGTRIALGHFTRENPKRSAERTKDVLNQLHESYKSSPYLVLTDHLFNDMPRAFTHAWRTPHQCDRRQHELAKFMDEAWAPDTLADTLGPVPAALLEATRANLLTPALNFDGHHVDLAICRRTVDYLTPQRLIAMTDDTELDAMAGEILHQLPNSPLRYRDDGAVASGSSGYPVQAANMASVGLTDADIETMFSTVPSQALAFTPSSRTTPVGRTGA
ncbi:hypothetical protein GCM10010441_29420 [Kitasatospora paracochleata]|uniref:N-acetylglucosamine-6-phosphate deacetylase n=1 Tax=Kitasatospora paracochleata TaxID=58354 RepID=A0ABT1JA09_9ACTN|nr:hypothetical protein [Kitasatospora paracochleata]MCP2313903.1 N-acetylglucosamine-6-phosphate deacetylase [Kitasatospora paracochleata]